MINVFVTNLGRYNEGDLVGEWLTLPATEADIQATFDTIGLNDEYEEYFLTDWECEFEGITISEYSNLHHLNKLAEKLENCDQLDVVEALMDVWGYELKEAMDEVDNCSFIYLEKNTFMSDEENLAYSLVDSIGDLECTLGEKIENYFDFEKFGRELSWDLDSILEDWDLEEKEKERFLNMDEEELGEWWINDIIGGVEQLGKETKEQYFDYHSFGRDLMMDYSISEKNMIAVCCY